MTDIPEVEASVPAEDADVLVTRHWVEEFVNGRINAFAADLDATLTAVLQELASRIQQEDKNVVAWVGIQLNELKKWVEQQLGSSNTATTGVISITNAQGAPMSITVDTTTGLATYTFKDDKGDTVPAPAGAVIAWASDNASVLTIDPASGQITPVSAGTANVSATVTGVTLADGSAYPAISVAVPVLPGNATAFAVTVPALTVDTVGAVATGEFTDDKGDVVSPVGATVAWASDNEAVVTVDPSSGALTPVAEGTANITGTVSGITLADGSAFPVGSAAATVAGGAPVSGEITITE